MLLIEAEWCTR